MKSNKLQNTLGVLCDVVITVVLFLCLVAIIGITIYSLLYKEFIFVMVGSVGSLAILAAFLGVVSTIIDRRRTKQVNEP